MFIHKGADRTTSTWVLRSREKAVRRAAAEREDVDAENTPPSVYDVLRTPGRPLPPAVRESFGGQFGHDFSGVRVHTDEKAASAAADVGAKAFTVGERIVFGRGQP